MRVRVAFMSLVVATMAVASCATAPEAPAAPEIARRTLQAFAEATQVPGVSVTVMEHGNIVWDEAIGWADLEQRVPISGDTILRVGSISKSMTAVAAVRLVSAGAFDFDRPITDYLEGFDGPAGSANARQLASHTGCVRGYQEGEYVILDHYDTTRAAMVLFADDPLTCAPGAAFNYSSFGYTILSAAIAAAQSQTFEAVMTDVLWSPLDMSSTGFDHVDRIIRGRARFYERRANGEVVNAGPVDNSYKWAGGGMVSSTRDLARFGVVVLDDTLLTAEERAALFTTTRTNDGAPTGYGLGWYVDIQKFLRDREERIQPELYDRLMLQVGERKLYWHSGTAVGGVAVLMMEPDEGLVLAMAMNLGDLEKEAIVTALDIMTIFTATE